MILYYLPFPEQENSRIGPPCLAFYTDELLFFKVLARSPVNRDSAEGDIKSIVFRALSDAFSAENALCGGDVGFFFFRVNGLDAHGAGFIAGGTAGAGGAVFFQTEQTQLVEESHQIAHGADIAPETAHEKAQRHQDDAEDIADCQMRPETGQTCDRDDRRAEIAEIQTGEGQSEEDHQGQIFAYVQNFDEFFFPAEFFIKKHIYVLCYKIALLYSLTSQFFLFKCHSPSYIVYHRNVKPLRMIITFEAAFSSIQAPNYIITNSNIFYRYYKIQSDITSYKLKITQT